ncbi:MAG: hypothetical protein JXQ96_05930 [Cyclobacteriaceae bacterium]
MKILVWNNWVLMSVLAILFFLAACGNEDKKTGLKNTYSTTSLRINLRENIKNFVPARFDNESEEFIGSLLYEGLFSRDSKGRLVQELVENYQFDSLTNTYNFQLKHGIQFSNGDKLSAFDVLRCFEGSFETGKSQLKNSIAGVHRYIKENQVSPDSILLPSGVSYQSDYSFSIQLIARDSLFINKLTTSEFLIYKELSESNIIGSGPFKVIFTNDDISLNLTRNEYYSDGMEETSIDRVNIRFIKNETTILDEFRSGALDVLPLNTKNTQYEKLRSTFDEKYGSKRTLDQSSVTLTAMKFHNFKNARAIEETIKLLIDKQPKFFSFNASIQEIKAADSTKLNLAGMLPKLQLINNSSTSKNSLFRHINDSILYTNSADIDRMREFIVVEEVHVNIFGPYTEKDGLKALQKEIGNEAKSIGSVIINQRRDLIIFDERLTDFKKYGNWVDDIQELKMKTPRTL